MTRRRSVIADARRAARRTDRLLGAVSAVQNDRVPQWVANRIIGRIVGRALRGVWR